MDEEKRAVLLPVKLVRKIDEKIAHSNYVSVEAYIEDVLNEVLKAEAMEIHLVERKQMEEIRERLKQLGYLD
jgi:Arc/MetJ-type ribon-helix-helix transcriptional regulator